SRARRHGDRGAELRAVPRCDAAHDVAPQGGRGEGAVASGSERIRRRLRRGARRIHLLGRRGCAMTAPATSATKSPSVLEDIVDVFYQPAAVFERRRTAGFGLAWLIYAIVTAAMIYAAQPVMRPVLAIKRDQAIAKISANPNL